MKWTFAFVLVLGLVALSCTHVSAFDSMRSPATKTSNSLDLTFKDLTDAITVNKIKNSQAMLEFFAHDPKFRPLVDNAVLERRSFALHRKEVNDNFPRIILGAGNLAMHLTGNPLQLGSTLVEVTEYVPEEANFHFNVIHYFPSSQNKTVDRPAEFFEKVSFTGVLPSLAKQTGGVTLQPCNFCHYTIAVTGNHNLNWNPLDGLFRIYGTGLDRITKTSEEYSAFQEFLATLKSGAGVLYKALDLNIRQENNGDYVFPNKPNQKLTTHIYELARKKTADSFRKFSAYSNYQYMIAGALLNCPSPIAEFLPEDSRLTHEYWTMQNSKMAGRTFAQWSVNLMNLGELKMSSDWKPSPGIKEISEYEFLTNSTLTPFETKLAVQIRQINNEVAQENAKNLNGEAAKDYLKNQQVYVTDSYVMRLAKLRYIFKGFYPEMQPDPFVVVDEVMDQASGASARTSYRLLGGDEYYTALLTDNLGPNFLKQNPKLNRFSNGVMRAEDLNTSLIKYCGMLKQESLNQFTNHPLDSTRTVGTNGDLCGDSPGHCRYPLACLDRGDGSRACTGGANSTGQFGQLCGGSDTNFFRFCSNPNSCRPDSDNVLRCH